MLREIVDSDLVGKTIKSIDTSTANVLVIKFNNDTKIELWTEQVIPGVYGFVIEDGQ